MKQYLCLPSLHIIYLQFLTLEQLDYLFYLNKYLITMYKTQIESYVIVYKIS
jgi:hypothetical protein